MSALLAAALLSATATDDAPLSGPAVGELYLDCLVEMPWSRSTSPRKQRTETPRSKPGVAELILWSNATYDQISDNFNKAFLAINDKKNMRSLTKAQVADLEKVKLDMLLNIKPLSKITEEDFKEVLHANKRMPDTFREHLEKNKITTEYMSIEEYKRSAIASYVDYVLAQK